MHKDGYMSSIDDLYNLKRCMSINDSYHKGMSASETLCLRDVRSDVSLHGALSDKTGAATVPSHYDG